MKTRKIQNKPQIFIYKHPLHLKIRKSSIKIHTEMYTVN